ncbi:MAG: ATP-dependent helicase, partial [Candidatus Sungbacteria bacterium]|nr:ATP-dependent helicase [Candidatus Sungbacteria bacterium]
NIDPAQLKKIANSPKIAELAWIYQKYAQGLVQKKKYDFEDMILETVSALRLNKNFLLDLQEKHQYILVDEHQDTNGAQNKILELLAGYDPNPNLFVVGDEKQAIFRFQGASLENFLYFKRKFPQAKIINLKHNYRSRQHILDASHSLIEKNTAVLALTKLKSQTAGSGKIKIVSLGQPEDEYMFVSEKIKEFIKQKTLPGEIAVLYRENKDAPPLADFLSRRNIPHAVESNENILDDIEIKKINVLLEAIANFGNDENLIKALHLDFLGVDPMTFYKTTARNALSSNLDIIKKLAGWKKLSYNSVFPNFFETVVNESGFLKNILAQPSYYYKLDKLKILFGEIKNLVTADPDYGLSDYIKHISLLKEHNLPLRSKITSPTGVVRLMTAHKAKGLEFDYVFITGAYNGHWGNKRNIRHFELPLVNITAENIADKNEDERRLFYMALTRARKNIFITYAALSPEAREQVPSQFINEIRPDLKEEIDPSPYLANQGQTLVSRSDLGRPKTNEKNLVKEIFLKHGLSPTALNNYLTCPWRFFYINLLRIPKTQNRHQIYGTAKHNALQIFFDAKKENNKLGSKFLIDNFIAQLKKNALTPDDYQVLRHRGCKSMPAYYNFYKNSWNYKTINELKISGVDFFINKKQTVRLTGKLDKVELDPKSRSAAVVDYKTKTPESRNWILGQTKNSNGDYFRQLVFYKLLTDSLVSKKFEMDFGVIDFTEPDTQGRFRKETFQISGTDVALLKGTIARASDEIINLKFWDSRCSQKDCEFCAWRELMVKK